MPYTRLSLETEIAGADLASGRYGRAMTARGAAVYVAADETLGEVPALGLVVAKALRKMGVRPADPIDPADADLLLVAEADEDEFLDRIDLACLESIIAAMVRPDETSGEDRQEWAKLRAMYVADAARLRDQIADDYGEVGGLSAGTLDLAFSGPRDD